MTVLKSFNEKSLTVAVQTGTRVMQAQIVEAPLASVNQRDSSPFTHE